MAARGRAGARCPNRPIPEMAYVLPEAYVYDQIRNWSSLLPSCCAYVLVAAQAIVKRLRSRGVLPAQALVKITPRSPKTPPGLLRQLATTLSIYSGKEYAYCTWVRVVQCSCKARPSQLGMFYLKLCKQVNWSHVIRTATRKCPFAVLGFRDKYRMARAGTMSFTGIQATTSI